MKRGFLIFGIVVGVILALGPVWGMLGTMFGMMHAFQVLGGNGVGDPKALSGAIGDTLLATTAGFVACPIGILLLVVCIVLLVTASNAAAPPPLPPPTDSRDLSS